MTNRTALANRNRKLAAFQHRLTWREEVRRIFLSGLAQVPLLLSYRPIKRTLLLIRPDHLGDMLLTMPAVQALKRAEPDLRLLGLAGAWSAPIMGAYAELDTVLTIPFPGFTRKPREGGPLAPYVRAWKWAQQIRALRIETAVILRPDHWWGAMLAWMAGIPNRVGYAMPDVAPFLTTAFPPPNQGEHVVMHSARLLERWIGRAVPTALKLTYPIQPNDAERVAYLLSKGGITPEKKIVVIHPGAGSPIKRWTAESWAIVAERIASKLDAAVVLTGADAERGEVAAIMDKMRNVPALSLAGETNVAELAALYSRAALVLGPDSGPLHLAVAVGTPTVHLYGPADPALFGPWGDPQRHIVLTSGIACRPCNILAWSGDRPENHPCIRDITPRQVMDAAFAALNVV